MWKPYRLDSELVQTARKRFYRNRASRPKKSRSQKSFEWYFERFSNPMMSIYEIAHQAGVGVTATRQLYENNFMLLCGRESPQERQDRISQAKHAKALAQHAANIPAFPGKDSFIQTATAAGFVVSAHVDYYASRHLFHVSATSIDLSGIQCRIVSVTRVTRRPGRKARYGIVDIPDLKSAAIPILIVVIAIPRLKLRVLIIPAENLPEAKDTPKDGKRIRFNILMRPGTRVVTKEGAFDPTKYENTWSYVDLLVKAKQPAETA